MDNNSKFKIAVIGIGGVGGYVGGKLAARFDESSDVEIALVARGENEKSIRADGLKLVTTQGEQTVRPKLVKATEIGDANLILLCTKEYSLEESMLSLKNEISSQTVILPLLNGVNSVERINKILPDNEVWDGCIYIVSRLSAPGVIQETGNVCRVFFGNGEEKNETAQKVEEIFKAAAMEAFWMEDIEAKIWEKFVFISSIAAATSYLNATMREIIADENSEKLLHELVAEIKSVARAKSISISDREIQKAFDRLGALPMEATSSMHTDFSRGRNAELQSLVGYVVAQAKEFNVSARTYEKIYDELSKKQKAMTGG